MREPVFLLCFFLAALCLAVTGMLGLEKGFKTIPENPMLDKQGKFMQMVYVETPK